MSVAVAALGSFGVFAVDGCSSPPVRKPIEMQPIGTVPNVSRTVDEGDAGPTTSPNSGTPLPGTLGKDPCTGGDFDLQSETFKSCEVPMPRGGEVPTGMREKLEVRVVPSAPSTTPGGHVDLTVTLKNKSHDFVPLYFSGDPTPHVDVEALDARGRRADLPAGKPPKGAPPSRDVKVSRITLAPGGTARVRLSWDAVKTKWAPEKAKTWEGRGYPRAPAGPLPAGKYMLRIAVPILGAFEKGELETPKLGMDVGS